MCPIAWELSRFAVDDPAWMAFVTRHRSALPFHHPSWATLLSECYGHETFVLALHGESGITAGIPIAAVVGRHKLPHWVSLPFTDRLPVLARSDDERARLATGLVLACREAGVASLQVRGELPGALQHDAAVIHTLALHPDAESVLSTFKKTQVRQRIARAERAGVTIRRATQERDLTEVFYRLHLKTRRRLGVPVQPRRYFVLLWRRLVERGLAFALIAEAEGEPAAAAVFLAWNGIVTYKYSASDRSALPLRPNNLLLWTAIRWGCERGFHTFDFGRSDFAHSGLRAFKSGWGTQEEVLRYSTLRDGKVTEQHPAWLVAAAGTIIRHSPPFVCRAAGELFYRYVA